MKKVLVLGSTNNCVMAHAYLVKFKKCKAEIYSAGIEALGIDQKAIEAMKADGIDISNYTVNNYSDYFAIHFDYIVIVSEEAKQIALRFNKNALKFDYHFEDPLNAKVTEEEITNQFIDLRNTIKQYIERFCKMYLNEWQ